MTTHLCSCKRILLNLIEIHKIINKRYENETKKNNIYQNVNPFTSFQF